MASARALRIHVATVHPAHLNWMHDVLRQADIELIDSLTEGAAHVVIDTPFGWTFEHLASIDGPTRTRTLVVTPGTHPAYLDCVASHHVSGVASLTEPHSILAGLYAAASGQRSYHYRSPLTFMELRVIRLLLQGEDTEGTATSLGVSFKTVNAHVSNALGKLGADSRAQLLVKVLGGTQESWDGYRAGAAGYLPGPLGTLIGGQADVAKAA